MQLTREMNFEALKCFWIITGGFDSNPLSPQWLGTDPCLPGHTTSTKKKLVVTAAPLTLRAVKILNNHNSCACPVLASCSNSFCCRHDLAAHGNCLELVTAAGNSMCEIISGQEVLLPDFSPKMSSASVHECCHNALRQPHCCGKKSRSTKY